MNTEYLTWTELANRLGISVQAVRNRVRLQGVAPVVRGHGGSHTSRTLFATDVLPILAAARRPGRPRKSATERFARRE